MSEAPQRKRANQGPDASGPSAADKLKVWKVPIIILLIWGLIVGYNVAVAKGVIGEVGIGEECPGHWHSTLDVQIDGELLSYRPLASDPEVRGGASALTSASSPRAPGMHIHDDSGILHYHPSSPRCIALEDALDHLGLTVTSDSLTVSSIYPESGTYGPDSNHTVRVFYQPFDKSWREVSNTKLLDEQMANGDRMVIAVDDGSASMSSYTDNARQLTENYQPPSEDGGLGDRFVPIMAVTLLAAVALFVWNSFRQKA